MAWWASIKLSLNDALKNLAAGSRCGAPNLPLDAELMQVWPNVCSNYSGWKYFTINVLVWSSRIPKEECSSSTRNQEDSLSLSLFLLPSHKHTNINSQTKTHTHTLLLRHTCTVTDRHHVGEHAQYSLRGTKTGSRHKMIWILSHEQTKTRTHRKLPQQPTKQRERVRMMIMTDDKKKLKTAPPLVRSSRAGFSPFYRFLSMSW